MNVSFFNTLKETTPDGELPIEYLMKQIKSGEWRQQVEKVRQAKTEAELKSLKEALPGFTGSGTFKKRALNSLLKHSGRIIIDVDKVPDVNHAKEMICADPFVEYAFTSCSGRGLAIVLKINGDEHNEVFQVIKEHFETNYNIVVDKGVRDISRIRFVSYDPDIYHNPKSKTFTLDKESSEKIFRIMERMIANASVGNVHDAVIRAANLAGGYVAGGVLDEQEAEERLLNAVMQKPGARTEKYELKNITDGIKNGFMKPLSFGEAKEYIKEDEEYVKNAKEAFALAHEMNRSGQEYNASFFKNLATEIFIDPAKLKNIFDKVYEENKDEFDLESKPNIVKIEVFLKKSNDFRRNEINNIVESKPKNSSIWKLANPDELTRQLHHTGYKFDLNSVKSLLRSDFITTYNPFSDYFGSLPEWDGTDYISELCSFVKTDNDAFFVEMFKKHLVRSIGCGLYGIVNRYVITFIEEKQNTGKTSFIRFLSPFGAKYYTEAPVSSDKDSEISLCENFIYNLDDIGNLNSTSVNRLKSIISKKSINVRRPFAATFEQLPRRCNFFGSTNETDFLSDKENTRWLCFDIRSIDWDYSKMNIRNVWSQAFSLYLDKDFNPSLTREEMEIQRLKNKEYERQDVERQMIQKYFEVGGDLEMTNFEIVSQLVDITLGRVKINTRVIGRIMGQLGFKPWKKSKNGHDVRGWYVKPTLKNEPGSILPDQKPPKINTQNELPF